MNDIKNLPDFKLIEYANSNQYFQATVRKFDEELEQRYESIREELEAYEEFENV
jgi:hypothetical protein